METLAPSAPFPLPLPPFISFDILDTLKRN